MTLKPTHILTAILLLIAIKTVGAIDYPLRIETAELQAGVAVIVFNLVSTKTVSHQRE